MWSNRALKLGPGGVLSCVTYGTPRSWWVGWAYIQPWPRTCTTRLEKCLYSTLNALGNDVDSAPPCRTQGEPTKPPLLGIGQKTKPSASLPTIDSRRSVRSTQQVFSFHTYLSVAVEVDLPLVEGDHPVVVKVEVLEAGYVCVGRVGVHDQVFPDVLVELPMNDTTKRWRGEGRRGGRGCSVRHRTGEHTQ